MQLDVLFETPTLDGMKKRINIHFDQEMRVFPKNLSVFEQYQVRFTTKFILEVWKYCIVCKGGIYHFGKLKE